MRRDIKSMTVTFTDGTSETFTGSGSFYLNLVKQKERADEGFPVTREYFFRLAHAHLHAGEVENPPKA